MSVLNVEGLSGGYHPMIVFRNARLDIDQGRTLGILGPNGAGKSTLLKTISGLLPAVAGRILFNGRELGAMRAHERARAGLVLVPEGRQILTGLTVRQNLELSRAAGRLDATGYARRFDEVLAIFPRLGERLDQFGRSLSGGEQQMLAIGRALMVDPVLLMLDEPTQGLAPIMVRQVLSVLQSLKGRLPIICVEQNRRFLDELADTVLTMRGGHLTAANER
ncbi:MAG TPA: ATP-binding cassette domain-containing protein [Stellaceae bacterium]|nr:ATP-binding cassette domain-containing protein [Stellaceae bacterium]